MKQCTICKVDKEGDHFFKSSRNKSGLQSSCKECCGERYNYPYKPLTEEQKSEYYARSRQKRIANREKHLWRMCKDRAKAKGYDFDLDIEDIVIPKHCPVLGIELTSDDMKFGDYSAPSVDRIDNSKGYIKGNIMIISRRANTMKNCSSKEELKSFCKFFLKLINESEQQE